MPTGAADDEIHPADEIRPANEIYPSFDPDISPEGAPGSIDSIIDALLDSLPPSGTKTETNPLPPILDHTTPFGPDRDVHSTLGKLSLRDFGKETEG
jgi:hypothetical protein